MGVCALIQISENYIFYMFFSDSNISVKLGKKQIHQIMPVDNNMLTSKVEVEVNLRPMVSRPVCLGVGFPSGAYDQIFFLSDSCGFFMWGTLFDERMGL
jgi:hypothetical protein